MSTRFQKRSGDHHGAEEWQSIVAEKVKGLRFGVVQIVVHDGHVVQIERTEKTRLEAPGFQARGGDAA